MRFIIPLKYFPLPTFVFGLAISYYSLTAFGGPVSLVKIDQIHPGQAVVGIELVAEKMQKVAALQVGHGCFLTRRAIISQRY